MLGNSILTEVDAGDTGSDIRKQLLPEFCSWQLVQKNDQIGSSLCGPVGRSDGYVRNGAWSRRI